MVYCVDFLFFCRFVLLRDRYPSDVIFIIIIIFLVIVQHLQPVN